MSRACVASGANLRSGVNGDPKELGSAIIDQCKQLGFARAGIAPVERSQWVNEFEGWLAAGKHGSMGYMAKYQDVRADPGFFLEGACSLVLVADIYHGRESGEDAPLKPGHGRIARYARGGDYHKIIKKRLHGLCDQLRERFAGEEFRAFTDTAPVLEREHAARAGLGWIGKHTLLIEPTLGSYLLLGGFATTLKLTAPDDQEQVTDHCGTCTACIDACPTDAITPHSVDARRCISYLTIERREAIDAEFFEPIGDRLFGCDICQEVCPHNSFKPGRESAVSAAYAPRRDSFDLLEVLGWTQEDRREAFTSSSMKRATLAMMRRNAAIVAGNVLGQSEQLRGRLEEIAGDGAG